MNGNVVRLLGLSSRLCLALALGVLAQPKRGWQDWQPIPSPGESYPFDAGFSNMELGGHDDYENNCEQKANELAQPVTYWYRLSDLVREIGTGEVQFGCQIGGEFVGRYISKAIQVGLDSPVCLRVQSDVGNGLLVREAPMIASPQMGTLRNGEEAFYLSAPALISIDSEGRQWLNVQQGNLEGWSSLAAGEGEHVNFRLCRTDV